MALLHLLTEEPIHEDRMVEYFEDLYRIVCVSERSGSMDQPNALVRTTYLVDWEQLVHLLEDYDGFGEDIVEVIPVTGDEARVLRLSLGDRVQIARA
jgi:hypothetical protein